MENKAKKRTREELSDFKRFLWLFKDLQKLSRQIRRIDEKSCNGYREEKEEIKDEKRQQKLIKRAEEIADLLGFRVYHQEDPRGVSLYLITEEMTFKGSSGDYMDGIPVY